MWYKGLILFFLFLDTIKLIWQFLILFYQMLILILNLVFWTNCAWIARHVFDLPHSNSLTLLYLFSSYVFHCFADPHVVVNELHVCLISLCLVFPEAFSDCSFASLDILTNFITLKPNRPTLTGNVLFLDTFTFLCNVPSKICLFSSLCPERNTSNWVYSTTV